MFTIDLPFGKSFAEKKLGGELGDLLDAAEHFGTPFGQVMILLGICAVSGWTERRMWRIFSGTVAAGLSANIIKLMLARSRPRAFEFELPTTFGELFPFGSNSSGMQSFPSAHTASAFGFAAMMSWAFPKGRPVFIFFAVLVAMQRVTTAAHFPSDVCFGAVLGWCVATTFTTSRGPGKWFHGLERNAVKNETATEQISADMESLETQMGVTSG